MATTPQVFVSRAGWTLQQTGTRKRCQDRAEKFKANGFMVGVTELRDPDGAKTYAVWVYVTHAMRDGRPS